MLYIKAGVPEDKRRNWEIWHVGDPIPQTLKQFSVNKDKIITVQADSDELLVVLSAIEKASQNR